MNVNWQDNLDGVARQIEQLNTPGDRATLYNSLGVAASEYFREQFSVPGRYFNDDTGELRQSATVVKGTTRYPSQLFFITSYAHIVDGGNTRWSGTDWVDRLIMENRDGAARAAVLAARPAWERFSRKINNATKRLQAKNS